MPDRGDIPGMKEEISAARVVDDAAVSFIHYWDAVQGRIALISAIPKSMLTSDAPTQLWSDDAYYEDQPGHLDEDISIAWHAAGVAEGSFRVGPRHLLMVSFRLASIINRRSRQKVVGLVDRLAPELRPYLVLRLVRVRPGTPAAGLSECVSFGRALTPHVCVHAAPGMLTGDFLQGCGASGISISLTRQSGIAGPDSIRTNVRQARTIAKTILAEGIVDREQFDACTASGVRFLAGPAIFQPCDTILGQLEMPNDKAVPRIALA